MIAAFTVAVFLVSTGALLLSSSSSSSPPPPPPFVSAFSASAVVGDGGKRAGATQRRHQRWQQRRRQRQRQRNGDNGEDEGSVTALSPSPFSTTIHTEKRKSRRKADTFHIDREGAVQHRDLYDHDAWKRGWVTVGTEECYELVATRAPVDGDRTNDSAAESVCSFANFPPDLRGTFYQNGPSKFQVGDEQIIHPFDGDGMIRAVTFLGGDNGDGKNNKAWFRNRFVRTPGYESELRLNKILYRGVFGTAKNRGHLLSNLLDIRTKNVANTHVLFRRGRQQHDGDDKLYALWEADKPIEMDPITLETITSRPAAFKDIDRYAAHYKIDPRTGTTCNFSIRLDWPDPSKSHVLSVMEHNTQTGQFLYRHTYRGLPGLAIGHDTAITSRYFCFFRNPPENTTFDPVPFLLGKIGAAQTFGWRDDAEEHDDSTVERRSTVSHLHLIPRGLQRQEPITIQIPKCFCIHLVNAYDDIDDAKRDNGEPNSGRVVIDAIVVDRMAMSSEKEDGEKGETNNDSVYPDQPVWETVDLERLPFFRLVRYVVDPVQKKLLSWNFLSNSTAAVVDFPAVHPSYVGRPYRYAYVGTSPSVDKVGAIQGLAKIDLSRSNVVEKWLPLEPHQFLSEVVVAPRQTSREALDNGDEDEIEDNAYLIGYLMDGRRNSTSIVVFDASCISKGPVASAELRQFLPHSLHGAFVPDYAPPLTDSVRNGFRSSAV